MKNIFQKLQPHQKVLNDYLSQLTSQKFTQEQAQQTSYVANYYIDLIEQNREQEAKYLIQSEFLDQMYQYTKQITALQDTNKLQVVLQHLTQYIQFWQLLIVNTKKELILNDIFNNQSFLVTIQLILQAQKYVKLDMDDIIENIKVLIRNLTSKLSYTICYNIQLPTVQMFNSMLQSDNQSIQILGLTVILQIIRILQNKEESTNLTIYQYIMQLYFNIVNMNINNIVLNLYVLQRQQEIISYNQDYDIKKYKNHIEDSIQVLQQCFEISQVNQLQMSTQLKLIYYNRLFNMAIYPYLTNFEQIDINYHYKFNINLDILIKQPQLEEIDYVKFMQQSGIIESYNQQYSGNQIGKQLFLTIDSKIKLLQYITCNNLINSTEKIQNYGKELQQFTWWNQIYDSEIDTEITFQQFIENNIQKLNYENMSSISYIPFYLSLSSLNIQNNQQSILKYIINNIQFILPSQKEFSQLYQNLKNNNDQQNINFLTKNIQDLQQQVQPHIDQDDIVPSSTQHIKLSIPQQLIQEYQDILTQN